MVFLERTPAHPPDPDHPQGTNLEGLPNVPGVGSQRTEEEHVSVDKEEEEKQEKGTYSSF